VPNESEPDLTLFLDILRKLESLEIPYVIIGGYAATMYGITRVTFDIDIIVHMEESHIEALAAAYPLPRYYADPYQMRNAMRIGSSFNIIDAERGEKADLFLLTMDLRYQPAFDNRVRRVVAMAGREPMEVWTARPEDVIVGKLMAWAEGRSQQQAVDIFEMMLFYYLGGLEDDMIFDEAYVSQRAAQLDEETLELWQLINESAREEASRH
jgi:hypothetical protein